MTTPETIETQPASNPNTVGELISTFGMEGLLMGVGITVIVLANVIVNVSYGSNKKNVLGTASWATKADIKEAEKLAKKQLANDRQDQVAMWINAPQKLRKDNPKASKLTIWVPDMTRGSCVIGGTGTGKSYGVVVPMLRSAIAQGIPTVLLDTDYPGLTKTIAPLAESVGYDVGIFAPGFRESKICNVLDFVDGPQDATGASQISKTLNANFAKGSSGNEEIFFKAAGELSTEGSLRLTKVMKYKDILTAFAILKDEDMLARVRGAGSIDPWLDLAFGQLLSTAKSEKTVDSIRGTATILFGQLVRPDILPSLVGDSTIPMDITGKKLLILGVKQDIRLVVSPLIASVIHAIITKNVLPGRNEPLFLSLDEVPSMYFPELSEWLSEKRKYGLCAQLGYQSLEQLKNTYGPEMANVIFTNTATKFLFNPQSIESAELFSRTLGQKDVVYKTTSRSYGKSRGRSRAEHRTKVPLFSPEEFLGLGQGGCVMVNPGYGKKSKFKPVLHNPIKISEREQKIQKASEDSWEEFRTRAIKKGIGDTKINTNTIKERIDEFHEKLPPIKGKTASVPLASLLDA